eukprot:TRINITY_DN4046_c0_g1_i1.p1 TRINITY_DN4046_c0_g1~~TRINITY_DN4046_c0_g1_i1.p1  ORF type:complete len:2502 (+),score=470.93 TRINITY_DN4046_c0_g1_i1:479-7507(+)
MKEKITSIEDSLESKLDVRIPIVVDYSFTTHPTFLEKRLQEHTNIIERINQHLNYVLCDSSGMAQLISEHEMNKEAIVAKIKGVVFKYDVEDSVQDTIGSYSHYKIELTQGNLVITVNLNNADSSCYYAHQKISPLLGVRLAIAMRATEEKIEEAVSKLEGQLEKKIPIVIDFAFFVNSEPFLEMSISDQENAIQRMVNSKIEGAFTGYDGLGRMAEQREIVKKAVQQRVHQIICRYDPLNEQDDDFGFKLESGNLFFTINLRSYNNGCYYAQRKFETLFELYVAEGIEYCNKKCEEISDNLEKMVDKKIPITISYSKFTRHADFASMSPPSSQKEALEYIVNRHLPNFLLESSGLGYMARSDEDWKEQVQKKVNHIIFEFDPENEQSATIGSYTFYTCSVLPSGKAIIKVNLENWQSSCYYSDKQWIACFKGLSEELQRKQVVKRLGEFQNSWSSYFGKEIVLKVDWSFLVHPEYQEMSLNDRTNVIQRIQSLVENSAGTNDGLASVVRSDSNFKSQIDLIDTFVHHFDCDDNVSSEGDYSFFQYVRSENVLFCLHNLKDYERTPYYGNKKLQAMSWDSQALPVQNLCVDDLPATLRSELNRAVGSATNVIVEQPNIGDAEAFQEVVVEGVDTSIQGEDHVAYTLNDEQATSTPTPQTPSDEAPHLPSPSPLPEVIENSLGKNNRTWLQKEKQWKPSFKKLIRFTFDWSFCDSPEFQSMDQSQKDNVMRYVVIRAENAAQELVGLSSDKVVQAAINERISRVIISVCPKNSVHVEDRESSQHWNVTLDDGDLKIVCNIDKIDYSLSYFEEKMDEILNMRIPQAKRDWGIKQKELQRNLKTALKKEVPIEINFDAFCEDPIFTEIKKSTITSMLNRLWDNKLPYIIAALGNLAKDKLYLEAFQCIEKLVVYYDVTNSVNDPSPTSYGYATSFTLDSEGTLTVAMNLDRWDYNIYDIEEKMDKMFNLRVAQAKRDCQKPLQEVSRELRKHIGKDIPVEIDFDKFVNHPNFLQYGAENLSKLTTLMERMWNYFAGAVLTNNPSDTSSSLSSVLVKSSILKNSAALHIDRIVLAYDPTSSIKSKIIDSSCATGYYFDLNENVLTFTINLDKWDYSLYEAGTKLNILLSAHAQVDALQEYVPKAEEILDTVFGRQLPIFIDWRSWMKDEKFYVVGIDALERNQQYIAKHLRVEVSPFIKASQYYHGDNLVNSNKCSTTSVMSAVLIALCRLSEHPLSKEAFLSQVSRIVFSQEPHNKQSNDINVRAGELHVHVDFDTGMHKEISSYDWKSRLEWQLGSSLPTYKDLAVKKIAEHKAKLSPGTSLEVDWKFLDDSRFSRLGNLECLSRVQDLSDLAKHVFLGLKKINEHPIGRECVQSKIHNVILKFSLDKNPKIETASNNPTGEGVLSIQSTNLHLTVDEDSLLPSLKSNLYDYLRFEYGLLVPTALYDGKNQVMRLQTALESKLGKQFPVEIDTTWTQHSSFRNLPYDDQYYSVLHLQSKTLRSLVERNDGLLSLFDHPTGVPKEAIGKEIRGLLISVEPKNLSLPIIPRKYKNVDVPVFESDIYGDHTDGPTNVGTITKEGGILKFTIPLQDVYISSIARDWKDRILDLFNLVVIIAQREVEEVFVGLSSAISAALCKNIPITVNQEVYTRQSEFLCLDPDVRTQIVKSTYTTLIEKVFLGDYGITGSLGLGEFAETRAQIQNSMHSILIVVGTDESVHNTFVLKEGTLHANFSSDLILQNQFSTCGSSLENIFGLRRIKEDAVFKEGSAIAVVDCKAFLQELGVPSVTFSIDWETLRSHPSFLSITDILDYVKVARKFAKLLGSLLVSHKGSLLSLIEYQPLKEAIAGNITKFVLRAVGSASDLVIPKRESDTIFLDVPFVHIDNIAGSSSFQHYKERFLDFFGLVVSTGQHETRAEFDSTCASVCSSLYTTIPISINWDFTSSSTFASYTPTERYNMVRYLHTGFASTLLLGDDGFTGGYGLCEFDTALAVIQNSIESIEIVISETPTRSQVSIENGVCRFFASVSNLNAKEAMGCHYAVENALNLRPIKEAAVKQEMAIFLAESCSEIPTKVSVDWNSIKTTNYGYVKEIRKAVRLAVWALVQSGSEDFGDASVSGMCKLSNSLYSALRGCRELKVVFGNKKSSPGKSKTLIPKRYYCSVEGNTVELQFDQRLLKSHPGPGYVVEFALCRYDAERREEKEVARRVQQLVEKEKKLRADKIASVIKENEEAVKNHQKAMARWEKECKDTEKSNKELCISCKGKQTQKCGQCLGKGSRGVKIITTCNPCSGSGYHKCNHCVPWHPGLRHKAKPMPPQPKASSPTSAPTFPDISALARSWEREI